MEGGGGGKVNFANFNSRLTIRLILSICTKLKTSASERVCWASMCSKQTPFAKHQTIDCYMEFHAALEAITRICVRIDVPIDDQSQEKMINH